MTKKQELLYYMDNPTDVPWKNIMGCSEKRLPCSKILENWYDPFYAVSRTFSREEIIKMSNETIEACLKVAEAVGEVLY